MEEAKDALKISIVVPVYNAEATIELLVAEITKELEGKYKFNFVLVDDGSTDNSYEICKKMALADKHVKFISFFKNFGQTSAVLAGFKHADGDIIIEMDDDLQNPPREVKKLIDAINKGYDFVFGRPVTFPRHSLWRRIASSISSKSSEIAFNKPKGLYHSSYYALRKEVVKEIIKYNGPYPYSTGLILRITTNGCNVPVEHLPRIYGKSGYNFRKLFSLWLSGITNFSILPLRISGIVGTMSALVGFVFLAFFVIRKLLYPNYIQSGWSSIVALILFYGGVQLLAVGIIGEYIGRIFMTQNRQPQYVIKHKFNCDDDDKDAENTK